ncbi:phosphatase [Synechococcales cyanobacterium C]|uniref:Phosphatase n=1 Tax=Petrachloros mirabilis ULC683 TaxID=2781853 RepID=A0A8K2A9L0_9CYAN|nr:sulfur transferase domain-containing protein [Petrachloros mirabilis]NCJ08305.1 phosphatase [Petrachloros mirabilis ULC683]
MTGDIKAIHPDYGSSGQPTTELLHQAATEGFKSVLNLRSAGEAGFWSEEAAAVTQELGLSYGQTPVSPLKENAVALKQALEMLGTLPKPVLIHCRGGNRATAVALIAIARQENLTLEQIQERAKALDIRLDQPQLQQFLNSQFGAINQ